MRRRCCRLEDGRTNCDGPRQGGQLEMKYMGGWPRTRGGSQCFDVAPPMSRKTGVQSHVMRLHTKTARPGAPPSSLKNSPRPKSCQELLNNAGARMPVRCVVCPRK